LSFRLTSRLAAYFWLRFRRFADTDHFVSSLAPAYRIVLAARDTVDGQLAPLVIGGGVAFRARLL
jgi:hypothetical protein